MASPSPQSHGPGPGPDPDPPAGPGPRRPRTGLVAAALLLFWPVGLAALSAAARAARADGAGLAGAARDASRSAHRRSWTAVGVGGGLLALRATAWVVLAVTFTSHGPGLLDQVTDRWPEPPVRQAVAAPRPDTVDPLELITGDCFLAPPDDAGWAELTEIELVPCAEEHDVVVIGVHEHEWGPYPGDDVIENDAWEACVDAYWGYMGADAPEYGNAWPWMPSQDSWLYGDRASPCLLLASHPVRGSLSDRPDLVKLDLETESA
ncbi:septum formation family protein [Myceligenerans indicum]|uniref:Septum formation-related domain-containing protein n=1 Tax=Myceligenerans indicum TaxID=2593663 RepID=A0ABS1LHR5_9MICO|nr:septum formation family protein [Myceligenerans indicum]MBL0885779.1 hypothetical protein [Myceligenerans indicum]